MDAIYKPINVLRYALTALFTMSIMNVSAAEKSMGRETGIQIIDDGKAEVYLSGYAYHNPHSYSSRAIDAMNKTPWGGGFGYTLKNERGNEESLFAISTLDSHRRRQMMAGYTYIWNWHVPDSSIEYGAGVAPQLISRTDMFHGRPFPALLPLATFGTRGSKVLLTYVPPVKIGKQHGDILFLVLRHELE